MERASPAQERSSSARSFRYGVLLVVSFTFVAWTLRVAFLDLDPFSSLTAEALLNEALRLVIFVGPVLLYLRYVEKGAGGDVSPVGDAGEQRLALTRGRRGPLRGVMPVTGSGRRDGRIGGGAPAVVLFTVLSPATLVEEIYFRGFLLNEFRQTMGFWRANLRSSLLFGLIHFPGWIALGRFETPFVAVDFVGLVVFGMVFGWAMKKTGSLWSAYLPHALYNLRVVHAGEHPVQRAERLPLEADALGGRGHAQRCGDEFGPHVAETRECYLLWPSGGQTGRTPLVKLLVRFF